MVVGVTSVGSGIGQAVVDSLLDSVMPVTVVGFEARPLARGQFDCDVAFQCPLSSSEDFLPFMLDRCSRLKVELLIPGSDYEVLALARHHRSFADRGIRVAVGSVEAVSLCRDKLRLAEYLRRCGAAFVETWRLAEALPRAASLPYPLVVKPRGGSGSVGVGIVFSAQDLCTLAARCVDDDTVLQPFLADRKWAGDPRKLARIMDDMRRSGQPIQEGEISVQFFVGRDGRELGCFASVNALKSGIPMVVEPTRDGAILHAARQALAPLVSLGLHGPVNLQGRETPSGVVFFEINPRFTGITHVRHLMGYREVEALVRHLAMEEEPASIRPLLAPPSSLVGLRQTAETVVPRWVAARFGSPQGVSRLQTPLESVLITGAAGYLGHELVKALLERELAREVIATSRDPLAAAAKWEGHPCAQRLRWVEWDLLSPAPPELLITFSAIVHAAAVRPLPSSAKDAFFAVNVGSTQALVGLARRQRVPRFVYVSSHAVYGTRQPRPWREDSSGVRPETLYASSKAAAEAVVENLGDPRVSWAIVRLAALYGLAEHLRKDELVHQFAATAAAGHPLIVFGGETRERDLLHVRDAVELIVAQLHAPVEGWNQVVNAGSGAPTSLRRVAELCASTAKQLTGREVPVEYQDHTADYPSYGMAIDRARERLGWQPRVSLEKGIEELVAAFASCAAGAQKAEGFGHD